MTTFASPETQMAAAPQERNVGQDLAAALYPKLVKRWEGLLPAFTAEQLSLADDTVAVQRTLADYKEDVGTVGEKLRAHYDGSVSDEEIYKYARSLVDRCDRNARSTVLVRDITEAVRTGEGVTKRRWDDLGAICPSESHRPGLVQYVARGFASYLSQSTVQGKPRQTTERDFTKALDLVAGDTESPLATLVLQTSEFVAQLEGLDEQRRPAAKRPPIDEALVERLARTTRQVFRDSHGQPSKATETTLLRLGQALEKRKSADQVKADIIRSATRSLGLAPRGEVEKPAAPIPEPVETPRPEPEVGSATALALPNHSRVTRYSLAALTATLAVGGVSMESAAASPVPDDGGNQQVSNTIPVAATHAANDVASGTVRLKKPLAAAPAATEGQITVLAGPAVEAAPADTPAPAAGDTTTALTGGNIYTPIDPGIAVTTAPPAHIDDGAIVTPANPDLSAGEVATTPVIHVGASSPAPNSVAGTDVLVQPGDTASGQPEVSATVTPASTGDANNSFYVQPGSGSQEVVPLEPVAGNDTDYTISTTSAATSTEAPQTSTLSPSGETPITVQYADTPVTTTATVAPEVSAPASAANGPTMLVTSPVTAPVTPATAEAQPAASSESAIDPTTVTAGNTGAVTMLHNTYADQQTAASTFADQLHAGVTSDATLDSLAGQYVSALQASGVSLANLPAAPVQAAETAAATAPVASTGPDSVQMLATDTTPTGETQILGTVAPSSEAGQTYYQMVAAGTDQDYTALQASSADPAQKALAAKALVLARTLANDPTALQHDDFAQAVHSAIKGPASDPVFGNYVEGMTPVYADGTATAAAHGQGIMDQTVLLVNQLRAAAGGYLNDQTGRLGELQGFNADAATQARRDLAAFRLAKLAAAANQNPQDTVNNDRRRADGRDSGSTAESPTNPGENNTGEVSLSPHALDVAAAQAMIKKGGLTGRQGQVLLALFGHGVDSIGALGGIGSLQGESAELNPQRVQGGPDSLYLPDSINAAKGGHGGFGIMQWTYITRQQRLLQKAHDMKLPEGDLRVQIATMLDEFDDHEGLLEALNNAPTVEKAAQIWTERMEAPKPGYEHEDHREENARKLAAKFNKYRTQVAAAHTRHKAEHQAAPRSLQATGTLLYKTLESFSWNSAEGPNRAKPAYRHALNVLKSRNKPNDTEQQHFYLSKKGADCGQLTAATLRYTGIDKNVWSIGTYNQLPYYNDHPEEYIPVANKGENTQLQDGVMYLFIVNKGSGGLGHTWFQYGSDIFGKHAYGASFGDEMPFQQSASGYLNKDKTSFDDGRGAYHIFAVK